MLARRIVEKTNLKMKTVTKGVRIDHKKPNAGLLYLALISLSLTPKADGDSGLRLLSG